MQTSDRHRDSDPKLSSASKIIPQQTCRTPVRDLPVDSWQQPPYSSHIGLSSALMRGDRMGLKDRLLQANPEAVILPPTRRRSHRAAGWRAFAA